MILYMDEHGSNQARAKDCIIKLESDLKEKFQTGFILFTFCVSYNLMVIYELAVMLNGVI